jgi:N-acetylmuramoyl-L-alanine amidase
MFQPDLTLSIHYNADEKNKTDRLGFHQLHNQQYSMVFVPGAFASEELNEPDELENWLRFLNNTQIEKSLDAARIFQRNIEDKLNIPAVDIKQTQMLEYLSKHSIPDVKKAGVFHRNLFLLQRSNYPIILLEPLLQDNREEFKKLIEKGCEYKDRFGNVYPVNCRIKEVAEVYFSALLEWQMNRIK